MEASVQIQELVNELKDKLPKNEVVQLLEERMREFLESLEPVAVLRNPALRPRHQEAIQRLLVSPDLITRCSTLGQLLNAGLSRHADELRHIADMAIREAAMEHTLYELRAAWEAMEFRMVVHQSSYVGSNILVEEEGPEKEKIACFRGSRGGGGGGKEENEEWNRARTQEESKFEKKTSKES